MTVGQMTQELVESKEYGYFIIKLDSVVENDRIKSIEEIHCEIISLLD